MTDVSARPALLKDFVKNAGDIRVAESRRITTLRAAYDQCAGTTSPFVPRQPGLMGTTLAALITTYQNDETFVDVVREAFERADENPSDGIATTDADTFDRTFNQVAYERGLDPQILLSDRPPLTVDDPVMAAVPQTSGFVAEPVCTATGHLVEVEEDFVWPDRLEVLRWRRVYSSRFVGEGPFGRGWGTWAVSGCVRHGDGSVTYQGPDGQVATFLPERTGGWQRRAGLLATLRAEGEDLVLTWDQHSVRSAQRWVFDGEGRLRTVWGPTIGTTTFEYASTDPPATSAAGATAATAAIATAGTRPVAAVAGRLAAVTHEGGRRLTVDWQDDRIVAIADSAGRTVRYSYNEAGDLIAVSRAVGDHRYVPDDRGRIVELWDADGVRLCHNTFDDDGRVLRQVSPFGRETVFSYLPGRIAVVSDTTDGPVSTWEHDSAGRLIALTNDDGRRMSRSFDAGGRVVAMTGFDGTTLTNRFDEVGNLVAARSTDGYTETWEHDAAGRITAYAAPGGQRIESEYDDDSLFPSRLSGPGGWAMHVDVVDGLTRSVVDADGAGVTLEHDADGNLVRSTDTLGRETRLVPHPSGAPREVHLPDGAVFVLERDDAGRLLALHAPSGDTWRIEFTPAGRRRRIIEPDGSATTVEHGSHGAIERLVDAAGLGTELRHDHLERIVGISCVDGAKWEFAHTAMGQLAMTSDPTGAQWLYEYDADGSLVASTDPLGARRRRRYDPAGRLSELIDPEGARTRFARDEAGRLVGRTEDDGATTQCEYDEWDRVVATVSADGGRTEYRYSPAGRLLSVRSPEGRGRDMSYDAAGRLVASTDTSGATTSYEWDAVDRLVARIAASGRIERHSYDLMGRRVWTEVGGVRWHFEHDHAGRITRTIDPLGAVQQFEYDQRGRLVRATDPRGFTVRHEYDERGNLVAVVDPFGSRTKLRYDAMRRALGSTDPLGRTTLLQRDAAGRIVRRITAGGDEVELRRDRRGLIADVSVNGRDVIVYERDRRGRPVLVHEPAANRTHVLSWSAGSRLEALTSERSALAWSFDGDGRVTSRRANGTRTDFGYDGAGRLTSMAVAGAPRVTLDRDGDGRIVALATGGTVQRRFGHDLAGRLVGLTQTLGDRTVAVELVRDARGRIVEERRGAGTTRYRYDQAGQLVAAEGGAGRWAWAYDAAGRLVREQGPDGDRSFTYDDAHQLVREQASGVVTTYRYDEDGRRVEETGEGGAVRARYSWDGLGRLSAVERDGRRSELDVDAFGSLAAVDGVELTWDPTTAVPELLRIGQRRMVGLPGQPVGTVDAGGFSPASADWHGSVGTYDPWGAPARSGADAPLGLGYAGELTVGDLVWLRNRAYGPATRQFLSADPQSGVAGTAVAPNPYHYAGNDPIGQVDPLGLAPVSLEQYRALKAEATGPQWGNIALLALTVGSFFIPGGPLIAMAVGAALGAAPGIIQGITTGEWDPMTILQGAVIGGVAGRFGAGTGSAWRSVLTGAGVGGGTQTATELWDAYLPGGDGSFDPEAILLSTAVGGVAGGAGYKVANRPRVTEPATPTMVDGPTGLRPSDFGVAPIADDPALNQMWVQAQQAAAAGRRPNDYQRYLQALENGDPISPELARGAFNAVNTRFTQAAHEAGHEFDNVHHWNYPMGDHIDFATDSRHLVPVDAPTHLDIHRQTTSNPSNIYAGPIAPEHAIDLGYPQTVLPPGYFGN